jgi:hypothetical protein
VPTMRTSIPKILVFAAALSALLVPRALGEAPPDLRGDPKGYLVPESWRPQARTLVDPGRSGLAGGLTLKELGLGTHLDVRYAKGTTSLRVHLVPAKAAPEKVFWKGLRIAIVEVERAGDDKAVDRALTSLQILLEKREKSWGWLRSDPASRLDGKEILARRAKLKEARRQAWLGQDDRAVRTVQSQLRGRKIDVSELLLASRVVYRTGRKELGMKIGKRALERATQSVHALGLPDRAKHRARLALGMSAAYAGEHQAALNIGRSLFEAPRVGCEGTRIAEALELAGHRAVGRKLLAALQGALPACGEAWAMGIDQARRAGDLGQARAVATAGMEARRGSLAIHSALARLELVEGRSVEAVTRAETAAGRGRGEGDGLITLAAVVAEGQIQDARYAAWDGEAARSPTSAPKLALGAMASYGRGDLEGLSNRLGAMRALVRSDHQLSALHAYALARHGKIADAEATLTIAWNESLIGPAHLAAEAALDRARGEDPTPAWRAYLAAIRLDPGPVPRGDVEGLVTASAAPGAASGSEAAAPGLAPRRATPSDADGGGRWPWIVGGLVVLGGLAFSLRGRGA